MILKTPFSFVSRGLIAALACLVLTWASASAWAQISGPSPAGPGVPHVGIFCVNSAGNDVVCQFGSGSSGGPATAVAGAFVDGALVTLGTTSDAAWTGTGTATEIAIEKAIFGELSGTLTVQSAPGQNLPTADAALDPLLVSGALQVTSDSRATTGAITTQNLNPLTGTPTPGSSVQIAVNGQASLLVSVQGTYTGGLSIQGSEDNNTWTTSTNAFALRTSATGAAAATIASAAAGNFEVSAVPYKYMRVTSLAAFTGTANIILNLATQTHIMSLDGPLPTGANNIGKVFLLGNAGNALDAAGTGATAPVNALEVACLYQSTPSALTSGFAAAAACDPTRALLVNAESIKATYFITGTQALAATPTDVFQLCGVASKKLRIRQVTFQVSRPPRGSARSSSSSGVPLTRPPHLRHWLAPRPTAPMLPLAPWPIRSRRTLPRSVQPSAL